LTFASRGALSSNGTPPSAFDTLPVRLFASAEELPSNDVVPWKAAVNRTAASATAEGR
jgi:hypothetical protein